MQRTRLIRFITVLLLISLTLCLFACKEIEYARAEDTVCVILQLSDLHLKPTSEYQRRTFRTIKNMVEATQPDIIVYTGDLTNTHTEETMELYEKIGSFMEEEIKIPWYVTFGNHDPQGYYSKQELGDYLSSLEYCRYEHGDSDVVGYGNQYYNVECDGKIVQTLFFLDTSGEQGGTVKTDDTQIEWYERSVKEIATRANGNAAQVVPSILFQHIPMTEFKPAYEEAVKNGTVLFGTKGEEECPADEEDLMFEKILELGSTKGVFVGHEHLNNYVVDYKGVRLSYTETCDHKMYIPTRGGTLINVKRDGTFTQQNLARKKLSANFKLSEEF